MSKTKTCLKEDVKQERISEEPTPGCYVKARYVLAMMGFFAMFNLYSLRTNLSVAIVAMVNSTNDVENSSNTCSNQGEGTTSQTNKNGVFNWNSAEQGLALGCYFYGYILSCIPGAWLATRIGIRPVLGFTMTMSGILTLCAPVAAYTNFKLFVALRILVGFFQGTTSATMQGAWAKWAPPLERSVLISAHISGSSFGTFVTLPLAGLIADTIGWEAVFYFTGGFALLWSVVWVAIIHNSPEEHPRISIQEKTFIVGSIGTIKREDKDSKVRTPWKSMFTSLPLLSIIAGHFANNWGNYTLLTMLPTYLSTILNFNIKTSGFISSLPYILQWFVVLSGGFVTDFVRSREITSTTVIRKINTTLGLVIPAVFIVLAGYVGCNSTAAIAFFSLSVGLTALTVSGCKANTLDIAPKYGGISYGISNTIANFSGFLAPQVVGLLLLDGNNLGQWQLVFWISAGVYLFGAFVYLVFGTAEEQSWAQGEVVEKKKDSSCLPKDTACNGTGL